MDLTVLVDNNTLIDRYFLGEPGLSFFIKEKRKRLLFDCGFSDVVITNATRMGINLLFLDYIIFSHCHQDHTWGIVPIINQFNVAGLESIAHQRPKVIAHPRAFTSVLDKTTCEIGSIISEDKLRLHFELTLASEPVELTDNLIYLGEIPRNTNFESLTPIGRKEGEDKDDYVQDDTALAYRAKDGLVIITGCSHAGICNIVEHARNICREDRVIDIIGGLHLLSPPKKQLEGTIRYLKKLDLKQLHPCHCTDFQSKVALASVAPLKEVGVGVVLKY